MIRENIKVLLIEDNPGDVRLIQEMLKEPHSLRIDLTQANRLDTGLNLLGEGGYDAVLLDLSLPDSNGLDTLHRINAKVSGLPVVVLTSIADEYVGITAVQAGAQDYLIKGQVDSAILSRSLRYAIERKQGAKVLLESERLLKEAQILGKIGNWEFNLATQKITWSDEVYVLYERDKNLGPPSAEEEAKYYPEEQAKKLREYAKLAVETGQEFKYDLVVKLPSGKIRFFHASMCPVKDAGGQIVKLFGTVQDMTERKRAETELQQAAQWWQTTFDAISDIVCVLSRDFEFQVINEAGIKALGLPREDIIGRKCYELVHHAQGPISVCPCRETLKTGTEGSSEYEQDGRWYSLYTSPIKGRSGCTDSFVHIVKDITERKRAEQIQARLVAILDATPDFVGFADAKDTHILYINPAGRKMIGVGVQEDVTRLKIADVHPEWTNKLFRDEIIPTAIRDGVWTGECAFLNRDSREIPVLMVLLAHKSPGGEVERFSTISRDITERKRAEEAYVRNHDMQAAMNNLLGLSIQDMTTTEFLNRALDLILSLKWLAFESRGSIFLTDEVRKELYLQVYKGFSKELLAACSIVPFGRCWCGRAAEARAIQFAERVDERHEIRYPGIQPHGHYCMPILSGDHVLGVINLYVKEGHTRNLWEEDFLKAVANTLAGAIERKRAEESLQRTNRALKTLSQCNEILVRTNDESELLQKICQVMVEVGGYKMTWVGFTEEDEKKSVRPVAQAGFKNGFLDTPRITWADTELGHHPIGTAIRTAKPCICQDVLSDPGYARWHDDAAKFGYVSLIALPLITDRQPFGALSIYDEEPDAFDDEEVKLLTELADDLAYGIKALRTRVERRKAVEQLSQSVEKLRVALEKTVYALASTAAKRDPYTAGHQQRVTRLAVALASEMGLSQDQINGIRIAGLVHDIGKIAVPAEILSKPTKLTDAEFNIIKSHAEVGFEIIKDIEFPWPVAKAVLQHHERLNGSGYPSSLKGDNIIIEAKILAVADVVEAMSSHRPYRAARGIDAALEEIKQNRGILYDRAVVDACINLFEKKNFKLESS